MAPRCVSTALVPCQTRAPVLWEGELQCRALWCPGNVRLSRPLLTFGCTEKTSSFYGQLIYRKFLFEFPAGAIKPEDSCAHRKPRAAPTWPAQSQLQGAVGRSTRELPCRGAALQCFGGVLTAEMGLPGSSQGYLSAFVLRSLWFT